MFHHTAFFVCFTDFVFKLFQVLDSTEKYSHRERKDEVKFLLFLTTSLKIILVQSLNQRKFAISRTITVQLISRLT